ncbi:zinc finger protein 25 isoform X1 [Anastrepha ludens]|uniref:zinc finger protein 25 isoform X1 n=2 Tax=Anastrepha ludens TaxID=28586 RepID=UPI0023AEB09B|nr:zinc finger protein 25 isoform X1 [Anastrepha ludens]XP_053954360.1 zinc finger protein 25 isoform X1 [Anastrepha ludens]XP_053954361.1 zinc finger protein 25 isoform X1 [Anastrepha ludens]XP_053954362.1 zinc finger protein 25 isoform X1 [Anastrepha ludens]XP_053954363.1 zinc finger protein 25 isoform X1 [Anastrepha ludens]XP_053954364.1 zinc finger protein 25 isoform X1 [Anastrepha ludens]XP_053954365.1 zinc finger protein 25 isoform X1 [Anastrepha ludens]XP_053954366.1 zinc finger prote
MMHSRRSVSKEDVGSMHTDSGISLSSPPAACAELCDGGETQQSSAATTKKLLRRRASDVKVTKRACRSKQVAYAKSPKRKKQKIGHSVPSENNAAAPGSNSVISAKQLAGLDVQAHQEGADLAHAVDSAASITVAIVNSTEDIENPVTPAAASSEKSISIADSAYSETDATQSAADLSDITHSACDSALTTGELASVATALPATSANKRTRQLYICHVCSKQFRGKNDLRRHMLIHSDERPYKCEQCGKCYRQAVNLRNHITSAHESHRQFSCPQCPKMFALKGRLRLHMRLHSGEKPYACTQCEKRFARGGHLQQHIISHHKASAKQYICEKCSTAFSTPSNLRAHMERHENGPDHYCEICKEHFPNEPVLRAHINKLHYKLGQFDCEICKKTIEDEALAKHMKMHTNVKTHVCEVCKAYFMQKSQYNVHMRMHTGERPYQCRICWQTYAYSSVLKLHIRKHTGEKPFQCLLCKDVVAFSQLAHFKTHMKKIHKQTNPYMCEGCQQFFKVKAELQAHMQQCGSCNIDVEQQNAKNNDLQTLSHLRFLMALLLKKISSPQKLQQLGYEKRLIDNVVVASLKLANRKACEDQTLSAIERMRKNVEEFLNWIVPTKAMETFRQEQQSVESILDKIVTMYMKHK